MKLQEWADLHNIAINSFGPLKRYVSASEVVALTPENRSSLYNLADFRVTSLSGGSYWLFRKLENYQSTVYANMRNGYAHLLNIGMLREAQNRHNDEFSQICLDQLIFELENYLQHDTH